MKFISWNVNGLRACLKKGFMDFYESSSADFVCLQETKMEKGQSEADFTLGGRYLAYWNSAVRKGYSGTAVFTKKEPLDVWYGMGIAEHDQEGRLITLEYEGFYLVCAYVPNSKAELLRLGYRMLWEDAMREYLMRLDLKKPVVYCGDLNTAHQEIDLKNPKSNRRNAGFTDEERGKLTALLHAGFTDIYRSQHPDQTGAYTWWSYMGGARERNAGWRIDYFIVSDRLREHVSSSMIFRDVLGSDHCPVGIELYL